MGRKSSKYGKDWLNVFVYDPSSPSGLSWAVDRERGGMGRRYVFIKAGQVAGNLDGGYWSVKTCAFSPAYMAYKVHKIIWEMHNGPVPAGFEVDHKDGNSRNNLIGNLRVVTGGVNCRNQGKRCNNTTGTTGVSLTTVRNNSYFQAHWMSLDGRNCKKSFSINKSGVMVAFRNACQHRAQQIARLNSRGAGYSERHGT